MVVGTLGRWEGGKGGKGERGGGNFDRRLRRGVLIVSVWFLASFLFFSTGVYVLYGYKT